MENMNIIYLVVGISLAIIIPAAVVWYFAITGKREMQEIWRDIKQGHILITIMAPISHYMLMIATITQDGLMVMMVITI